MSIKSNRLRDAIVLALVGGVSGLGLCSPLMAADDNQQVLTTGSTLPRDKDAVVNAPILVIDRDDIRRTGLNSLGDVLFHITSSDGRALRGDTTSQDIVDGQKHVSLRSLGSGHTLVLVNGRRWIQSSSGNNTFTDLNTIPLSAVERIEILKDGASALYGSDAVAGVVNVIMRSSVEDAEANLYWGRYSEGDGDQQAFDFTVGGKGDRWQGILSIAHQKNDEVLAIDREISREPVFGGGDLLSGGLFGSGTTPYGNMVRCAGAFSATPNGFQTCTPVAGGPFTLIPGQDGLQATDFRRFISYTVNGSGSSDRFNFALFNDLIPESDRSSLFAQGSMGISDRVNVHAMAAYVQTSSEQMRAAAPLTMDVRGVSGQRWAFAPTATNVFNPFGQNLRSMSNRLLGLGPRLSIFEGDNAAFSLWFDGSFELGGRDMHWDFGYDHRQHSRTAEYRNEVNLFNLRQAVGSSRRNPVTGALECLDGGGVVIPGCVPLNLFGGPDLGLGAGVITLAEYEAMLDYLRTDLLDTSDVGNRNAFASIGGSLAELSGGPLAFKLGVESRRTTAERKTDALAVAGGTDRANTERTDASQDVNEIYAEFHLPLFADTALSRKFDVGLAVRRSDYESEGLYRGFNVRIDQGAQTSSRLALDWQLNEQFMMRASASDSFRAPDVLDLFSGGQSVLINAADPCSTFNIGTAATDAALCIADGSPALGVLQNNNQIAAWTTGNPILQPEEADTLSLGFTYRPQWADGLSIGVDWYQTEIKNLQSFVGGQGVLNGCYRLPGQAGAANNALERAIYCAMVTRDAGGNIIDLRQGDFNLIDGKVRGVDISLSYVMPEVLFGDMTIEWNTSVQSDNDLTGIVGRYDGNPNWETRSNLNVHWQNDDWDATWAVRYYSSLEESCSGFNYFEYGITPTEICTERVISVAPPVSVGFNRLPSRFYHDVQVGWKTPWNGRIAIGARNVFGTEPPIARSTFRNSYDGAYDLPGGGFYYLQYSQNF